MSAANSINGGITVTARRGTQSSSVETPSRPSLPQQLPCAGIPATPQYASYGNVAAAERPATNGHNRGVSSAAGAVLRSFRGGDGGGGVGGDNHSGEAGGAQVGTMSGVDGSAEDVVVRSNSGTSSSGIERARRHPSSSQPIRGESADTSIGGRRVSVSGDGRNPYGGSSSSQGPGYDREGGRGGMAGSGSRTEDQRGKGGEGGGGGDRSLRINRGGEVRAIALPRA